MKKARLFGLALIGAVALMAGCANDEATTCADGDKAACAEGAASCKDKAASGCCKDAAKAAEAPKN